LGKAGRPKGVAVNTCTPEFARLTAPIEGVRCDGNPFLTLRNPFALQHWTFPVIEALLIIGAIACLVHALRWYRRRGDSSNLVLWCALVLALLLVEPVTYFPQWFGLQDQIGLVFAHGQFSVQFFFDRLPDYIVAMYPVFGYVAYALVQRTGIFTRYNAVVGATCVAFGFLCFFEVIDTVGPQWRWWVWNTEIPTAKPSMGVVPYASLQGFSLIVPFAIALVTRISARTPAHGWQIVRNVVLASLGVWPLMVLSNVLSLALGLGTSQQTGRFIATWLLISAAAAITAYAFVGAYRTRLHDPSITPKDVARDHFAAVCAIIYLAFGALFWIAALPDYLAARNGVTPSGDPTGSLTFAVLNYLMSIAFTWGAYTHSHGRRVIGRQPLTNHRSRLAQTRNANRHIPDTATHGASRSDP
jgi:hypothetical protein